MAPQPPSDPIDASITTIRSYLGRHPQFIGVVACVIPICRISPTGAIVLLLRRSSTDAFPGRWEVPGGVANPDETIPSAAAREFREETGLHLDSQAQPPLVGEFEWYEDGLGRWRIFMFMADVSGDEDVKLDPAEHEAFVWATEREVRDEVCGEIGLDWISVSQRTAILDAFDLSRPNGD